MTMLNLFSASDAAHRVSVGTSQRRIDLKPHPQAGICVTSRVNSMRRAASCSARYFMELFVLIGMVTTSVVAQDSIFAHSSGAWSASSAMWSLQSGGPYTHVWTEPRYAIFEGAPATVTLTGLSPLILGLSTSQDLTLATASNEHLQLACDTATIDVGSTRTVQMKSALSGSKLIVKKGSGTLMWANPLNGLLPTVSSIAGTMTYADNARLSANAALRAAPVTLASSCSLSYSGTNAADLHCGALSGAGAVAASGASSNGIVLTVLRDGQSSATLSCGSNSLSVRGFASSSQTLSGNTSGVGGTWAIYGFNDSDSSSSCSIKLTGTASIAGNIALRGGSLILDNRTTNLTTRLSSSSSANLNLMGGAMWLYGNAGGTTQNLGVAGTKAITLNAGAARIVVETPQGASARTQLGLGGANSNFSLRDNTNMVVDFTGHGGTLGGTSAIDPRIVFLGSGTPLLGLGGLLANTAPSGTPGFATINGNQWASWGSTGVIAATFTTAVTSADLQAGTTSSVVDFRPSSTQTLSANAAAAAMRISPSGASSLAMGTRSLTTTALMLDGSASFTISGTGNIANSSNTRYFYVTNPTAVLSLSNLLGASSAPINKAGSGTMALNGSANQLAFSSSNNMNVLQGVLRATAVALGGAGAAGGSNCTINLRGGILELDGGMNFVRAVDLTANTSGGSVTFDAGTTNRGSGGFSAINGDATVTLVSTIGGSSTPTLVWNDNVFLAQGASLLLSSRLSDSRITLTNSIGLDAGTSSDYNAREVFVYDNPTSSSDCARLSGSITGSAFTDLVKNGPGVLELSGSNSYAGNTIVHDGTLRLNSTAALPTSTNVHLMSGTIRLNASQHIVDCLLDSATTLDLGSDTLFVSGSWINNGATIIGAGFVCFAGSMTQILSGRADTIPRLIIDNTSNVILMSNLHCTNSITFVHGKLICDHFACTMSPAAQFIGAQRQSGWVVGNMTMSCDQTRSQYEVSIGDTAIYSPLFAELYGIQQSGSFDVRVHPHSLSSVFGSTLDSHKLVRRNWSLTTHSLNYDSMSVVLTFDSLDRDTLFDPSTAVVACYRNAAWYYPEVTQRSSNSVTVRAQDCSGELQIGDIECQPKTIHISAIAHALLSHTGDVVRMCGDSLAISMHADSCYKITDVVVDSTSIGVVDEVSFANITKDHFVHVVTEPVIIVPTIHIQSNKPQETVCQGDDIVCTASASHGGVPQFQWRVNGEDMSSNLTDGGATIRLVTPADGDIIECLMQSTEVCAQPTTVLSNELVVHVLANPLCTIASTDSSFCPGQIVVLHAPDSLQSYRWTHEGAATIIEGCSTKDLSIRCDSTCNATFTLGLNVTSFGGCESHSQRTFVVRDTISPWLQVPADITISCFESSTPEHCGVAGSSDNCSQVDVRSEDSVVFGACQQSYAILRTWTAFDACQNVSSATQIILIRDAEPPLMSMPPDISVQCYADIQPPYQNLAEFEYYGGSITDACSAITDFAYVGDSVMSAADTYQTHVRRRYRATDACGNIAQHDQWIIVADTVPPEIQSAVTAEWWSTLTLDSRFDAQVIDNCDPTPTLRYLVDSTEVSSGGASLSGVQLDSGIHRVEWIAQDASANSSTHTLTMHVVLSGNGTVRCSADTITRTIDAGSCTYTVLGDEMDPAVEDNCPTHVLSNSYNNDSSLSNAQLSVGIHTIVWQLRDICSSSSLCVSVVRIVDNQPPMARSRSLVLALDSGGHAHLDGASVDDSSYDACSSVSLSVEPHEFDCLSLGSLPIILRVSDASLNTTTSQCSVTVIDTIAPRIKTKSAVLYLDATGVTQTLSPALFGDGSNDNCGITSMFVTPSRLSCADRGQKSITFSACDASGNCASTSCIVEIRDTVRPVARAKNCTVLLSAGTATLNASMIDSGSTDNCGISSTHVSKTIFTCQDVGTHHVRLTVRDAAGNSSSCRSTITVRSRPDLEIRVRPATTDYTGRNADHMYLGYGAQSDTLIAVVDNDSNCSFQWSPATNLSCTGCARTVFTPTNEGLFHYTVTATGSTGCTKSKTIELCVRDVHVQGQPDKVRICHNGSTLCLNSSGVAAHLRSHNRARLGRCQDDDCDDTKSMEFEEDESFNVNSDSSSDHDRLPRLELSPNPFSDELVVVCHGSQQSPPRVRIYDVNGRECGVVFGAQWNVELRCGGELVPGAYIIVLESELQRCAQRVVKLP